MLLLKKLRHCQHHLLIPVTPIRTIILKIKMMMLLPHKIQQLSPSMHMRMQMQFRQRLQKQHKLKKHNIMT